MVIAEKRDRSGELTAPTRLDLEAILNLSFVGQWHVHDVPTGAP